MLSKNIRILSIVAFLLIWEVTAFFIASSTFPSISQIATSLYDHTFNSDLLYNLGVTLYRVFVCFFVVMFLGIIFGILMGISKKIDDIFDFILILGLNIPALVTIVICYIWFGLTDFAALLAVILNKLPIVIVNVREGTKAIDRKYMQLAKVYKVSKQETFFKVFLPQIYPYIMASTRLCLSLIWKIVLVVELLGRSDGIGFKISMFFQFFDITSILAYSFAFVLVILLIEKLFLKPIDLYINKWK